MRAMTDMPLRSRRRTSVNTTGARGTAAALLIGVALACTLAACGIAPAGRTPAATYDFGPPPAAVAAAAVPLLVHEVAAPVWLDTPGILYRLVYANAAEPRTYGMSRWVSSPAHLLTQRLRVASAGLAPTDGVRADYALRVELLEFSQTFDTPERSRGVLRARAILSRSGALVAQRNLSLERAAPGNDAAGGARALAEVADAAAREIADWARGALPAR